MDENTDAAAVLQPLKERAERILKDLEDRKTTGLAAMDELAALAAEKETAMKAARESGVSARAFGVYWSLRDDPAVKASGIDPMGVAREADKLLGRFPNSSVNSEERRRMRAALYQPLLKLAPEERSRVVELAMAFLVPEGAE
jgi:type I restriction enzyme R subunit